MKDKTLENFMKEFFHYPTLRKVGFFTKEMRGDYEAQAKRVCEYFGYKTVYEYGAKNIRCHMSFPRTIGVDENGKLHEIEPFVTEIKSIYE